jgi:hypothetical protein
MTYIDTEPASNLFFIGVHRRPSAFIGGKTI